MNEARDLGEKSLAAANESQDQMWQLNASVLIAQAESKGTPTHNNNNVDAILRHLSGSAFYNLYRLGVTEQALGEKTSCSGIIID